MGRLLWDAGWVTKASFLLWRRRLFPLRRWAPVELSPIDVWVNGRILKEHLEFRGIVVSGIEELFECPDASTLFLEKRGEAGVIRGRRGLLQTVRTPYIMHT